MTHMRYAVNTKAAKVSMDAAQKEISPSLESLF